MRIFERPNLSNDWKCPICKTADIKPVTLISIRGTYDDGIMEAEQFHVDCIEPQFFKEENIIAFKW